MQNLVGIGQRRLTMHAACRFGRNRRIRIAGQRSTTTLTTKAAGARLVTRGFLGSVRLLPFRWWQARIVSGFRRIAQLGFELRDPVLRRLKPSPQRQDQRILFGLTEPTEVCELGHPKLESSRP